MSVISRLADEFRPSRIKDDIDDANRLRSEHPRIRRRWAARSRRRVATVLVGVLVLGGTLLLGWQARTPDGLGLVLGLILTVIAVVFIWLIGQLNMATRLAVSYRHLDERQRIERDRSTRIGHHVTGTALIAALALVAVLNVYSYDQVSFPGEWVLPLLWLITVLHVSVPCAYLAWTQPDETLDDGDETLRG